MNKYHHSIILKTMTVLCLAIAGCASQPIDFADATRPTAQRIYDSANEVSSEVRNARITFIRDRGFTGSMLSVLVYVDGTPIASLDPGETVSHYVTAGTHTITAHPKGSVLAATHQPSTSEVTMRADGNATFRLGFDDNVRFSLYRDVTR